MDLLIGECTQVPRDEDADWNQDKEGSGRKEGMILDSVLVLRHGRGHDGISCLCGRQVRSLTEGGPE
jgi:hypothetical protein